MYIAECSPLRSDFSTLLQLPKTARNETQPEPIGSTKSKKKRKRKRKPNRFGSQIAFSRSGTCPVRPPDLSSSGLSLVADKPGNRTIESDAVDSAFFILHSREFSWTGAPHSAANPKGAEACCRIPMPDAAAQVRDDMAASGDGDERAR
ncbi:hypothetical protein ACJRO7_012451 [Eucalyptus globulus]|uniref:Uncharacterized protein n=1 Tax=Eucalyptus globulus TaxID=34317 RepID=A0ABD3LIJ7_EUCGL